MTDSELRESLRNFQASGSEEDFNQYLKLHQRAGLLPPYCFCQEKAVGHCPDCGFPFCSGQRTVCATQSRTCEHCQREYCQACAPKKLRACNRLRDILLDDYLLETWDTGRKDSMGKYIIGYQLLGHQFSGPAQARNDIIFRDEMSCSPMDAIDSDETLRAIINFITLRPEDVEEDYFENYTERQWAFVHSDAERLSLYGIEDSEIEAPELIEARDNQDIFCGAWNLVHEICEDCVRGFLPENSPDEGWVNPDAEIHVYETSSGYEIEDLRTGEERGMGDGVDMYSDASGRSLRPGTRAFNAAMEEDVAKDAWQLREAYFDSDEEQPREE